MSKNKFFLFVFLSVFFFQKSTVASEESFESDPAQKQLTLVVGNTRKKGGVKESVAQLVGQEDADFTHTQSFKGRVVSLDLESPHEKKVYDHLVLDFIKTKPDQIIDALGSHPARIFFEWLPSYVENESGNNITPLLLPALKNAFNILAVNGEVIIEHMPHAVYLPDEYTEALGTLIKEVKCDLKYLQISVASPIDKEIPGIISKRLQEADPFTLHVNRGLHMEMRAYLLDKAKNKVPTSPQKYTDYSIIDKGVEVFAKNFGVNKPTMAGMIQNGLVGHYAGKNQQYQGYFDLFDVYYYMETQRISILKTLSAIGFENASIEYLPEPNPYNGRKHSWIIKAFKSSL